MLGRTKGPRESMIRNLAASVVLYEKVKTTETKAKVVRSVVEKMITKGKTPTLAARRELQSFFYTEQPVKKILEVLGPKYQARAGGYTRITRLGKRQGDAAEMVQIELV
ncbi:MAG: 50S ribosomal protein L17 [bacterium]|nr:50S ribosomal protein L17 [bacterium]